MYKELDRNDLQTILVAAIDEKWGQNNPVDADRFEKLFKAFLLMDCTAEAFSNIPEAFAQWLKRMTAARVGDRFSDARDALERLEVLNQIVIEPPQFQKITPLHSKQLQRQALAQSLILWGVILSVAVQSILPGSAALETVDSLNYTVDKLYFWVSVLQHPLFHAPSNFAHGIAYWLAVAYGYGYLLILGSATAGASLSSTLYLISRAIDWLKSAQNEEITL
jgi:hypothetical protein